MFRMTGEQQREFEKLEKTYNIITLFPASRITYPKPKCKHGNGFERKIEVQYLPAGLLQA
jgi:hypothetical protein